MPNRLADSTSPYLLQHADNPVDWYPWGEEAFDRARREDKPVLLSVGYSACHWCHVMAHESFEDADIARQMNALFVCIKVDREERPDVDAIYMEAVQALSGHGGWPLTAFLTPDGRPFFGGTYFPPAPRMGMHSFPQILEAVSQAWRERRGEVEHSAGEITNALRQAGEPAEAAEVGPELLAAVAERLVGALDRAEGGFGGAPKFPQHGSLRYLLGFYVRTADQAALDAATLTLAAMTRGGVYDHLGGGFHRYSVDARWAVPHFEKMLYDNAQLARLYLEAWQLTGVDRFREVVVETLDYLLREMTAPGGGFYAAQDADTPGGEGAYFTWTPDEIDAVLSPEAAGAARAWYGVTASGNYEGRTVLATRRRPVDVAEALGIGTEALQGHVDDARRRMRTVRDDRPRPATDTKIVVDWNALTIDVMARAGAALGRADYLDAARAAATFILSEVRTMGGLAHSWRGGQPGSPAFLEDYAGLAGALVTLYESDFDPDWLLGARRLADSLIEQFRDPRGDGFYRIGLRHEALIVRQKELTDASVPSGNALAADALLRLSALLAEPAYEAHALSAMCLAGPYAERMPTAFGATLSVAADRASGLREIAVIGPTAAGASTLLAIVRSRFRPGTVLAHAEQPGEGAAEAVPLMAGRTLVGGRPAAYVCRRRVCDAPVVEPDALAAALDAGVPAPTRIALWPGDLEAD